ncbi:MAG TPA: hypothetical protein PKK06_17650 [Phycisphaerae bacterium]|nr:hypothetical protein [Phycisphaerae bacterium]
MNRWKKTTRTRTAPGAKAVPAGDRPCLLIVEPEPLLQWSLGTYLSRWFEVFVVDSAATAQGLLDEHPVDLLVVSDALPDHAADKVETWARLRNCSVTVVRTVTDLAEAAPAPPGTHCVEKPFELSTLAALFGVDPTGSNGHLPAPNGRPQSPNRE